MRRLTEEEIRAIEEKKNAANVAGLLLANPPKAHDDKEGGKDNVQSHSDQKR